MQLPPVAELLGMSLLAAAMCIALWQSLRPLRTASVEPGVVVTSPIDSRLPDSPRVLLRVLLVCSIVVATDHVAVHVFKGAPSVLLLLIYLASSSTLLMLFARWRRIVGPSPDRF